MLLERIWCTLGALWFTKSTVASNFFVAAMTAGSNALMAGSFVT